jgi:hypothetical protein
MNTTRSSILAPEVPGYTELQGEMHDALRAQHPEWIEADDKSPTSDYYESLFAALLVSHRAHPRAHYDHLLNNTKTERPNDREFAKNSRIFAAFAPGANRAPQFFFPRKSAFRNSTGIRCADTPSTKGNPRL